MKKVLALLFAGTMLTGCYTHICPTYAVKPEKVQERNTKPSLQQHHTAEQQAAESI